MQYLFGFGDSWPQGSELKENEENFVTILGRRLGIGATHNFAVSSSSIPHLILQFRQCVDFCKRNQIPTETAMCVFFLTGADRDFFYYPKNDEMRVKHLHILHPDYEDQLFYRNWHTKELVDYRVNTTLIALQKMCGIYGMQDRYIWGWERLDVWPEVDDHKFCPELVIDWILEGYDPAVIGHYDSPLRCAQNTKNRYIWPNSGHPNQLGHELIARNIEKWLKM